MARTPSRSRWRAHLVELVVLVVGVVAIVVLWAGNRSGGGDDDGGGRGTTTTTTTLMAGEPGAEPSSTTSSSVPPDGATSGRPLAEAVLRRSDLPDGWSPAAYEGSADPLCAGQDPLGAARPVGHERVAFSSGTKVLGGTVSAFSSTDQARELLHAMRAAASACSQANAEATFRIVDIADVGDESVGVTFTVPGRFATIRGVVYVARVGNRSAAISATSTDRELDEALALRALRAEVDRL